MNGKKRNFLMVTVLLVLLAAILVPVSVSGRKTNHLIAKIRYFDGSMDTIRIVDFVPVVGSLRLTAEDGHIMVIGANNVILIEDEAYWEEGN